MLAHQKVILTVSKFLIHWRGEVDVIHFKTVFTAIQLNLYAWLRYKNNTTTWDQDLWTNLKKWNFENNKMLSLHENYFLYEFNIVIFQKKTVFKKNELCLKKVYI